jgi:hypothetical protein
MLRRWSGYLLLMLGLLVAPAGYLVAQDGSASDEAGSAQDMPEATDGDESDAIDQGPIAPEAAGDSEQTPERRALERFIPSEQISQDLGVSFPVDI